MTMFIEHSQPPEVATFSDFTRHLIAEAAEASRQKKAAKNLWRAAVKAKNAEIEFELQWEQQRDREQVFHSIRDMTIALGDIDAMLYRNPLAFSAQEILDLELCSAKAMRLVKKLTGDSE